LAQLATHLPVPKIAEELFLSPATVRTHASNIYRKLGVHSRSEAVDAARARGLLS
jgi:LuxR family maltose regulon positive regulatory protein